MLSWASRARRSGAASPMGDAVARLPPRVARLRISGEANNFIQSWTTTGAVFQRASISLSVRAAPSSTSSPVSRKVRNSGRASTLTKRVNRRPRRFDSTARSVAPATRRASGCDARSAEHSESVAGRRKLALAESNTAGPISGAGWHRRSRNESSGAGPSDSAASRMGR